MKEIKLTQGKVALVDDEDFEYLNQWKWHTEQRHRYSYARSKKKGLLHRLIMNTPRHLVVDHINHNGLDNRKINLRNCTIKQNLTNKVPRGSSKYLGVDIIFTSKGKKQAKARIRVNKKRIQIGTFSTEELAALAYNKAAIKYHGEFANLNIIERSI